MDRVTVALGSETSVRPGGPPPDGFHWGRFTDWVSETECHSVLRITCDRCGVPVEDRGLAKHLVNSHSRD